MSLIEGILGSNGKISLRHFAIGTFTLDVVIEENYQRTWTKSESSVESGARISDHRIANPIEIMIRGTVVNYENLNFVEDVFPQTTSLLNNLGLPIQVSGITNYTIATVNRYATNIKKYSNMADNVISKARKISQATSFSEIPSLLNDNSDTDDRITRIKNTLEQIADSETLIEVMTSMGLYKGVQISGVSVVRNNHGSAEFAIVLSEIPLYEVEVVGGIDAKIKPKTTDKKESKPTGKEMSERPAAQSAKAQNKGKTTPQKSSKSALKALIDSAKGVG